jgi:hypothetical protein
LAGSTRTGPSRPGTRPATCRLDEIFLPAAASATVYPGGWSAYPGQTTVAQASVQQPINTDGSSNFKADRGVIPVKFALAAGVGPFVFQSIGSDALTANDYSILRFTPATPWTIADITTLSSVYDFTTGNCHGGSLRWQIDTSLGNLHVYYGEEPNTTDCTTLNQSDVNMVSLSDLRVDTSGLGGTFYDTWEHALSAYGTTPVSSANLILDSGWGGDQVVDLTSAWVNDNLFIVQEGSALAPTCDLPSATIKITKLSGATSGTVNEPLTIQPNDSDGAFRVVDCKYMYNLDVKSLSGAGRYQVEVVIGGVPAMGPALFDLR